QSLEPRADQIELRAAGQANARALVCNREGRASFVAIRAGKSAIHDVARATRAFEQHTVALVPDRIQIAQRVADRARAEVSARTGVVDDVEQPAEFLGLAADEIIRGGNHVNARALAVADRARDEVVEAGAGVQADAVAAAVDDPGVGRGWKSTAPD